MKRLLILSLCTASLVVASDTKKGNDKEHQKLIDRCEEFDGNEYYQTLFLFWGIASYKLGDRAQAEFFFEKSAALGDADGAYYKARMIEKHHTGPHNIEKALEWYRIAEERGHSHAQRDVNRLINKRKALKAQKSRL